MSTIIEKKQQHLRSTIKWKTKTKKYWHGCLVSSVQAGKCWCAGKCLTTSSLQEGEGWFTVLADFCSVNTFTTGVTKYNRTSKTIKKTKFLLGNGCRNLHIFRTRKSQTNTYSTLLAMWSGGQGLAQALACIHIAGGERQTPNRMTGAGWKHSRHNHSFLFPHFYKCP